MPLTVLSDSDVRTLLLQLTKQDILDLQQNLADALHHYSTSTEEDDNNGCCESFQSAGTSLKSKDGGLMTVTPASRYVASGSYERRMIVLTDPCSNDGLGVKITTRLESSSSDTASVTSSMDSLALSHSSTPASKSSATTASRSTSLSAFQTSPSNASLTLFDRSGNPRALLNSSEMTAFRTALASTMLFKKRANVHDVVVFGAGKQAYWHIRLALLLRGDDIHHLNIINRDFERVHQLLERLYNPHEAPPSNFNPDEKYPLAFLVHGGPESAWNDSWSTRWNPAVFAEQGYVVVAPDTMRGSSTMTAASDTARVRIGNKTYIVIFLAPRYRYSPQDTASIRVSSMPLYGPQAAFSCAHNLQHLCSPQPSSQIPKAERKVAT